jgi:hypothetical protein
LVVRRARVQWQLVVVVTAIAVLACTLISSLALLVAATELGAVRGALSSATVEQTEIRVGLTRPEGPLSENRATVENVFASVLGDAASVTALATAESELYSLPLSGFADPLVYLGELDSIEQNTTLVEGAWPTGVNEVALPQQGAAVLGLTVGDTVTAYGTTLDQPDIAITISGTYDISDPTSAFWGGDIIAGAGYDPRFPVPGTAGALQTDAVGPLVVADGTLDTESVPVQRLTVRFVPSFSATTADQLAPLQARLAAAPETSPAAIGDIADAVDVTSRLDGLVDTVTAAMTVTRSTVVVVSLLLFVLSVAALGQAARLLTEARVAERHLMRARGASARQVLALAAVEALLIAAFTAAVSPLLARLVYLLVAQQPAMVAAGMAGDPGVPPIVVGVSAAIGGLFWVVLITPLLGREASFHEGEQGKGRQRRFSGLQRSGVDVAVLVLAGVAYWQLVTYQGPSSGSTLGVDPVLVAGPALVLLAGAFLAVRIVPAVSVFTERLAERGRGAVVSLAAWEIGRRAQRATAAILLLTLALAVGTFSHSFLASWRQSQIDQSAFALGAPLRLTADTADVAVPQAAQPVLRSAGLVAGPDEDISYFNTPNGEPAAIVGLTADARELLRRDRLGDEGGSVIADSLSAAPDLTALVELPDDSAGIAASVRVTSATELSGIVVRLRFLIENAAGQQSTVDMGVVPLDGEEHYVRGDVPEAQTRNGLRIIGFQAVVTAKDPTRDGENPRTRAELLIRDLTSVGTVDESTPPGAYPGKPVAVDPEASWRASGYGNGSAEHPSAYAPDGWQLGLGFTIPLSIASEAVSYAGFGWMQVAEIPAVLTRSLADTLDAKVADRLTLIIGDAAVPIKVVAISASAPGGGSQSLIDGLGGISDDAASTVVVDEVLLARALYQAGVAESAVREWWLDLPEGEAEQYLPYLAVQYEGVTPQSAELLGIAMQQDPLRVATQGSLWLVILGAAALAAVGFAVHSTGSLRSRAIEFAQLRAVGLSRRRLVAVIGIESLLISVLGTVFGIGLGVLLAYLVGPLVGVTGDGTPAVPAVQVIVPSADIALLAAELAIVLAAIVLIAARVQRVAEPASALRRGDER